MISLAVGWVATGCSNDEATTCTVCSCDSTDAGVDAPADADAGELDGGGPDASVPPPGPFRVIAQVGPEELAGTLGTIRPSVAVDGSGQPHVVINDGDDLAVPNVYLYHRIGAQWQGGLLAQANAFHPSTTIIETPHIEIDPLGRAWISAHLFQANVEDACGQAVFLIDDVATAPTLSWQQRFYVNWGFGHLATDPHHPDQGVVMSRDGAYQIVSDTGAVVDSGQMFIGQSGEKLRLRIHPRSGQEGVWHGVMGGWTQDSSSYQNSLRHAEGFEPVTWADYTCYPGQGDDRKHPSVGIDAVDPDVAYIASRYNPGVVINVWNGSEMIYPTCSLQVIEPSTTNHGNGCDRFGPQWTPARGGGAFLCWTTSDSKIRMTYVHPGGFIDGPVDVAEGRACTMATDAAGSVHLVYARDGVRYRKLETEPVALP